MDQLFVTENISQILIISTLFYFVALAPIWIPGTLFYRYRKTVSRPFLFIFIVACLSYGFLTFIFFIVAIPAEVYSIFIAPQQEVTGEPHGFSFMFIIGFFEKYALLFAVIMQISISILISNKLIKIWVRVCASLQDVPNVIHRSHSLSSLSREPGRYTQSEEIYEN